MPAVLSGVNSARKRSDSGTSASAPATDSAPSAAMKSRWVSTTMTKRIAIPPVSPALPPRAALAKHPRHGLRPPRLGSQLPLRPDRPHADGHGLLQDPDGADDPGQALERPRDLRPFQPHEGRPPRRADRYGRIARAARPRP